MKLLNAGWLTLLLVLTLSPAIEAQSDKSEQYTQDVSSLDNILEALYASISGEKGEARDWDRFRNLFIPEARLMPSSPNAEGKLGYQIWTPNEYVERAGAYLEENGFFEKEIHRVVEEYGSLIHAFSTYESYRSEKDKAPFARGINSIQLMNDGQRWWVVSIYWRAESESLPLPKKYLPKG